MFIVDGMSSDRTREIVLGYCARHPFIALLDNPDRTAGSGLNVGIRRATGGIVMRLDAHSQYPPDYISRCVALLESTGAGNAGGRLVNEPNGDGPWARPIARATAHRFGVGGGAFRTSDKPGFVDTVPFGTYRRGIFDEVGLFDERLTRNQDNEFNARIIRAGHKIAFDPAIRVTYKNQAALPGLCHQAYFTGMWNIYTLRLHPHSFQWRRFIPAGFVLYLFSLVLSPALPGGWWALYLLPLAAYAGLDLRASLDRSFPLAENLRTAATFLAYHVCYGAGTFHGVANLLTGRWRRHLGKPLRG